MQVGQNRATGLSALVGRAFGHRAGTLVRGEGKADSTGDVWKVTACRMCGNKAWCTARVRVRNGVVVGVEGDQSNPMSQGKLCSRGQAAVFNLYNPYRVKTPMKRTNPKKGMDQDPGWVEIGWEEALSTVAARLKKIREGDPRRFAHMWGFGGDWWIVQHESFLPAFGTPNLLRSHGVLCPVHYGCSLVQGTMLDKQDVEHCRYLLTIGGTLGPNIGSSHSIRALTRARERGMKIVVVDPRCSHEASMADEWVPIRPGTDLAFSLALLSVVMNEVGVYDVEFLKRRSNAVYLIGPDGYYVKDPASGKPLVWDPVDNRAKSFDDPTIRDFALEGRYRVDGVEAAVAFTLVKEQVRQYTPEWQEPITTVPAATVRRIARELVEAAHIGETIVLDGVELPYRPAIVKSERGALGKRGGAYQHLVNKMLGMLLGAIDVPGGDQGSETGPVLSPGPDGVVAPKREAVPAPFRLPPDIDLYQYYPNRHTLPHMAWKVVLDPAKYGVDYELEALMIYGGNPVTNNSNPDQAIAALSRIPFVVTIAYVYDEAAELSDILLPESAMFERYGIQRVGGHFVQAVDSDILKANGVMARQPVLPAYHNTRQADEIYLDLAERTDFLYGEGGLNDHINRFWGLKGADALELGRRYTTAEILDRVLRGTFGVEKGLRHFDDTGFYLNPRSLAQSYNYYYYPLGTTRYPFYFEHTLRTGDTLKANLEDHHLTIPGQDMEDVWRFYRPIPQWVGRPDDRAAQECDLIALNWSTQQFRMNTGDQTGNPILNELVDAVDPYQFVVLMNSETARRKGLREGDRVVVEAYWGGRTEGILRLTDLLHPEALGIPALHGFRSMHRNPATRRGPHFNALICSDEGSFDPLHGGVDRNPRASVYRVEPKAT